MNLLSCGVYTLNYIVLVCSYGVAILAGLEPLAHSSRAINAGKLEGSRLASLHSSTPPPDQHKYANFEVYRTLRTEELVSTER